jgi:hypothetical protein
MKFFNKYSFQYIFLKELRQALFVFNSIFFVIIKLFIDFRVFTRYTGMCMV